MFRGSIDAKRSNFSKIVMFRGDRGVKVMSSCFVTFKNLETLERLIARFNRDKSMKI